MIVESITGFACNILTGLFGLMEWSNLPFNLINTLAGIMQYGTWVVGSDILLLFTGSVMLWWGVKASIGVGIWVYEHLPLT